jgi:pimeloyl-ACP methyl ester carboxylesterase
MDSWRGRDATLRLRDGRTLGYAEYGRTSGNVLLYFGSSRLEAGLLAEPAERAGVRVIGLDRPGMGLSQFKPDRRLLDWPRDVVELADQLGIDEFAVIGVSAGGPHALACAHATADRLTACGIVSGVGPTVLHFRQRLPWLLTSMVWLMSRFFRDEDHARMSLTRFMRGWPASDRISLRDPLVGDLWAASLVESFRQGARGMGYDSVLVEARRWGFELDQIHVPRLHLWHGELDEDVPVAMGRAVAERLASCTATYYPEEGHLSVIVNHRDEIVRTLTG